MRWQRGTQHRHVLVRHRHPTWHGHCDPHKPGFKRCDRWHWHWRWTHYHIEHPEVSIVGECIDCGRLVTAGEAGVYQNCDGEPYHGHCPGVSS